MRFRPEIIALQDQPPKEAGHAAHARLIEGDGTAVRTRAAGRDHGRMRLVLTLSLLLAIAVFVGVAGYWAESRRLPWAQHDTPVPETARSSDSAPPSEH